METTPASMRDLPPAASIPGESANLRVAGRLVVVLPYMTEAGSLAGRIHDIALGLRRQVLLLGLVSESLSESELHRQLTMVASFLATTGTESEIRIEHERSLLTRLPAVLGPEDELACYVVQGQASKGLHWTDLLADRFNRPVHVLLDESTAGSTRAGLAGSVVPWLGSMAVILGFFLLQVRLSQLGTGPAITAVLLVSIAAEIGLIFLCNSIS